MALYNILLSTFNNRHLYDINRRIIIWATTWQNQQSDCVPSKDSEQPVHPPSLIRVFTVRMKKAWVLSYPSSTQRRLWSNWDDAQADLSLRWVHCHFVGFVMTWLILCCSFHKRQWATEVGNFYWFSLEELLPSCHKMIEWVYYIFKTSSCNINWARAWQNNQMVCTPSRDSYQPEHLPSLIKVFSVRVPLSMQWRLWSGWADTFTGGTGYFVILVLSCQLGWLVENWIKWQ